jgi:Cd2+/Zn2+-exporting ATPase
VLIKGGRPLEDLGELNASAFGKTEPLIEGTSQLTNINPLRISRKKN